MADPTLESGRSTFQTVWIGHSVARRMGGAAKGSELDKGASIPRIGPVMPAAARTSHTKEDCGLVKYEALVPHFGADGSSTITPTRGPRGRHGQPLATYVVSPDR